MGEHSKIQWLLGGSTWNPVRGCSHECSAGCANCYAARMASRFNRPGDWGHGLAERGRWTGEVLLVPEKLADPLSWKKPRLVFVNSMGDLFHERVPDSYIAAVFGVMAAAPRHTFIVLTKRPKRMREWCSGLYRPGALNDEMITRDLLGLVVMPLPDELLRWPLPNVWVGTSVCTQRDADLFIPDLLATPAARRIVSCEPLIESVDLTHTGALGCDCWPLELDDGTLEERCSGHCAFYRATCANGGPGRRIDLCIVGGESGPKARPFDLAWARSIRDQCREADVPYFFKQAGSHPIETPCPTGCGGMDPEGCGVCAGGNVAHPRFRDRSGADPSEWPEDLRVREMPEVQS
jgi:protein gp37